MKVSKESNNSLLKKLRWCVDGDARDAADSNSVRSLPRSPRAARPRGFSQQSWRTNSFRHARGQTVAGPDVGIVAESLRRATIPARAADTTSARVLFACHPHCYPRGWCVTDRQRVVLAVILVSYTDVTIQNGHF